MTHASRRSCSQSVRITLKCTHPVHKVSSESPALARSPCRAQTQLHAESLRKHCFWWISCGEPCASVYVCIGITFHGAMNNEYNVNEMRQLFVCKWLIISLPAYARIGLHCHRLDAATATERTNLFASYFTYFYDAKMACALRCASRCMRFESGSGRNGLGRNRVGELKRMINDNVNNFRFCACITFALHLFSLWFRRDARWDECALEVANSIFDHIGHIVSLTPTTSTSGDSDKTKKTHWKCTKNGKLDAAKAKLV